MKRLFAAGLLLLLTGCAAHDPQTRQACVSSHEEHGMQPMFMAGPGGVMETLWVPRTDTVCDVYREQKCTKWHDNQVGGACDNYQ